MRSGKGERGGGLHREAPGLAVICGRWSINLQEGSASGLGDSGFVVHWAQDAEGQCNSPVTENPTAK